MKQIIYILVILLTCSLLTGCAAVIGAAIGGAAIATTGSIVASRSEGPLPPVSDNPYPVECKSGNKWMENHLMCPSGGTFTLKGSDKNKETIICPYHKQTINVEEARKRYFYYYYAKKGRHPLPIQYLTEHDKKKYDLEPLLKEEEAKK